MQRMCPIRCQVAPACTLTYFAPICPCPVTVNVTAPEPTP